MAGILVDTNVLVYAHDRSEAAKQRVAIGLLEALQGNALGRLPAQCLAEFFRATTRTVRPILSVAEARAVVEDFVLSWTIFDTTAQIVQEAARGVQDHRLAFYDAQIWASARLNQALVIFSEDFADGTSLEGVRFVNPFATDFSLTRWLA